MLTRDYEAPNRLPYSVPSHSNPAYSSPAYSSPAYSSPAHSSLLHSRAVSSASPFITTIALDRTSAVDASSLLGALLEALPKGLIVLSQERAIVYWNQAARRLCQKLSETQRYWSLLPTVVTELCGQMGEAETAHEPALLDYQTPDCCSFRLTACWLLDGMGDEVNLAHHPQIHRLITIEDKDEVLRQDIQLEQQKFHLTNREAEVWLLLKREYSYQAIATALHISLNTVKTHIRNIHAKRHPYQSLPA